MNYVKHLNEFLERVKEDARLNPTHISLYLPLFRIWNISRFPESFFINREEAMSVSKIGSKCTYHRCISNLAEWRYIDYFPSRNPYKGSRVKILNLHSNIEDLTKPNGPGNDLPNSQLQR